MLEERGYIVLFNQLSCILQRLIVASKSCNLHAIEVVSLLNIDIEITYQIARKVVTGYLKQQFVLVN